MLINLRHSFLSIFPFLLSKSSLLSFLFLFVIKPPLDNVFSSTIWAVCSSTAPDLLPKMHPLVQYTFLDRSEEHTSELQSRGHLVCRLLLEKKNILNYHSIDYI